MKVSFSALLYFSAHLMSIAAEDAVEHKMFGQRLPYPARDWIIKLDGAIYSSIEELKQAVERLPAGSKLTWYTGCFLFFEVTLGEPPRMKLAEFQKFCSGHGVTFTTNNQGSR